MITEAIILILHNKSIEKYGGAYGIRDQGLMESAIARPYQTFGGTELYPTFFEKAAAIAESLIINHPFVDGNKRTGFLAMIAMLEIGKLDLIATEEVAYEATISISTGQLNFEQIVTWLKADTTPF